MDTPYLTVDAPIDDVEALLREKLTAEEFALLRVVQPDADPFTTRPMGDIDIAVSVVKFTASAIAGGILYDSVKNAYLVLKQRYGDRVKRTDTTTPMDDEAGDDDSR